MELKDDLVAIERALRAIELRAVVRPALGPKEPPTDELVHWGIKRYAYAVIAHVRTVLSGLILLADAGNTPTIYIVGRHLFEWTLHVSYALENFETHLTANDLQKACDFFFSLGKSNSWIKRHGSKYGSPPPHVQIEFSESIRIKHLINAYKKYGIRSAEVEEDYGFLSELSHAGISCLANYHREKKAKRETHFTEFNGDRDVPSVVSATVVEWLYFTGRLLALAKDDQVSNALFAIAIDVAKKIRQKHSKSGRRRRKLPDKTVP